MKKLSLLFAFILSFFILSTHAQAHPADMYSHAIRILLVSDGLTVEWEIKSGPLLASWIWNQADANQDDIVSQDEADAWSATPASLLRVTLDGKPFPLNLQKVTFPAELNTIQSGADYPTLTLFAAWPKDLANRFELNFYNRLDDKNSVNWYGVSARNLFGFELPRQKASRLELDVVRDPAQLAPNDAVTLISSWDSNTPVLQLGQAAPDPGQSSQGGKTSTAQEVLIGLVKQQEISFSFYILALGISLVLGALHALTPGHGKTVVAAYLVGARGTTWHAIVLGSVVTLTHTGSVLLIGTVTLVASRYILPTSLLPILEVLSGLLIVGLGLYLLYQRWRDWRHSQMHAHGHSHEHDHEHHHHHDHDHDHDHAAGQGHSHEIPETLTWRSLIALGVSGGLVPCPDAIAILLVAIAIQRIFFGLALIVSFSLGLAAVLISIGLVMVHSRKLFDRLDAFSRFAPAMPLVSAVVVLVLGIFLTYGAVSQALGPFNLNFFGAGTLENAQIIYLADDSNAHRQLFLAAPDGKDETLQLTSTRLGVMDYALAPDQTQVLYIAAAENSASDLWLVGLDGTGNRQVAACPGAMCRNPVWSPDGQRVVYESIDLGGGDSLAGIPTLWWLDLATGDTNPVFQKSNLPVTNPAWSPDGVWLSFATPEGVRLYHLEKGESRLIGNRIASLASWAADSQSLIVRDSVNRGDVLVTQLFRYDLNTQQLTPFNPDLNVENLLIVSSPSGDWVAVVRRPLEQPDENQIWLVRADGSDARQLARLEHSIYANLVWSPDGKYLLGDMYLTQPTNFADAVVIFDIETGDVTTLANASDPGWVWNNASFLK